MSTTFAYAKLGPHNNCFRRFFEERNAFVFWWKGVSAEDWMGNLDPLVVKIRRHHPRQPKRNAEEARGLWQAIHGEELTAFTILPTKLSTFTICAESVVLATNEMRNAWPDDYKKQEVLSGRELVYVRVAQRNFCLADVPNLLYSLPCDRRVAFATFYPISGEKYSPHIALLSKLTQDQGVVVTTPRERLLYLGPQQVETAIALALMQGGVDGISLRPHNLQTWDLIGTSHGRLLPPLPADGGIYVQIKRSLTMEQRNKFQAFRRELDDQTRGFLMSPAEETEVRNNVLGGDWLADLLGHSDAAMQYIEGCIGRWVGIGGRLWI